MLDLGTIQPGTTLYIPFHTFDSNDPSASVTLTGLATTDIEIYKDGSVTQRASDSGYALLDTDGIDFDGITGIHGISISLADNATAGFYAAGSQYWVVISSVTVDAATINFIAATFRIGYPGARLNTTIATLASQTSFTLTAGPAEDGALNGAWCVIHDVASAVQCGHAIISDYTGATKTVTLAAGTTFVAAATDNISIMGPAPAQPTVAGRTLDVTATGAAGIDWANVENPTTALNLSATNIDVDQVVASVSGAVGSVTGSVTVGTNSDKTGYSLTATTGLGNQTANITGNLSGSVGSVTGAVGSVTGAVGSVTGAVGSVTGAVGSVAAGGITASSIATGAVDADALATDAVTEIADGVLDRNMATGSDSGTETVRTTRQALRAARNKVAIAAGTATVYKEDDTTASWTAAITTTAGDPISTVDPASA